MKFSTCMVAMMGKMSLTTIRKCFRKVGILDCDFSVMNMLLIMHDLFEDLDEELDTSDLQALIYKSASNQEILCLWRSLSIVTKNYKPVLIFTEISGAKNFWKAHTYLVLKSDSDIAPALNDDMEVAKILCICLLVLLNNALAVLHGIDHTPTIVGRVRHTHIQWHILHSAGTKLPSNNSRWQKRVLTIKFRFYIFKPEHSIIALTSKGVIVRELTDDNCSVILNISLQNDGPQNECGVMLVCPPWFQLDSICILYLSPCCGLPSVLAWSGMGPTLLVRSENMSVVRALATSSHLMWSLHFLLPVFRVVYVSGMLRYYEYCNR